MIRKYLTQQQYDDLDGRLNSNVDYVIVENGNPINVTFVTNNITGLDEMYDFAPTPEGSYNITKNGEYDVAAYASAYVDVPMPEGSYNITENGEYDVTAYASAYVDVPSGDKWLPIYASSIEGTLTTLDDNTLPNDVSYIRPFAFYNYENIASINVPSVTYVARYTFYKCIALTSAYMPSVTYVADHAFMDCASLTSAYMPSVTYVADGAFSSCASLTSAYMPSVTYVADHAFNRCKALTSAYMPLVEKIEIEGFRECRALTSVELPNIEVLGNRYSSQNGPFYWCDSLAMVDLGPNITFIGDNTFVGCNALTSFTCRATTPPTLGEDAFGGTPANLVIYVPAESVDAYKAASRWSDYADKIQAIAE